MESRSKCNAVAVAVDGYPGISVEQTAVGVMCGRHRETGGDDAPMTSGDPASPWWRWKLAMTSLRWALNLSKRDSMSMPRYCSQQGEWGRVREIRGIC